MAKDKQAEIVTCTRRDFGSHNGNDFSLNSSDFDSLTCPDRKKRTKEIVVPLLLVQETPEAVRTQRLKLTLGPSCLASDCQACDP